MTGAAALLGWSASLQAASPPHRFGVLILYRPGAKWLTGKPLGEQPLQEHGRYMATLYRRGVLQLAGPFADDSGGAVLLNVSDLDAARAIAEADPAVRAATFAYELRPWRMVEWEKIVK